MDGPQSARVPPSSHVTLLLEASVLDGDLPAAVEDLESLADILGRLYRRHVVVVTLEPSEAAWTLLVWAALVESLPGPSEWTLTP